VQIFLAHRVGMILSYGRLVSICNRFIIHFYTNCCAFYVDWKYRQYGMLPVLQRLGVAYGFVVFTTNI